MHLRPVAVSIALAGLLGAGGVSLPHSWADEAAPATETAPATQAESEPATQSETTGEDSAWAGGDPDKGKQVFASNGCGWCHEGGGRKQGRAPVLMDSKRSDDFLALRISNGSPGRMPAFGASIDADQITDLIAFIRAIKPEGQ
jgi:mono/diheme cytochrome c family protein